MSAFGTAVGGHWEWEDSSSSLVYITQTATALKEKFIQQKSKIVSRSTCLTHTKLDLTFVDAVDLVEQQRFRRTFQRRTRSGEPDVVTLQDVKDVVLFQCASPLTRDFLNMVHTECVDRFLRVLVLYFQQYLLVVERTQRRRPMRALKLTSTRGLTKVEEKHQRDLRHLRTLVAREYGVILEGGRDFRPFHHSSSEQSQVSIERDLRLFEPLYSFAVRVVYVALHRRGLALIESELNRMFRSPFYNLMVHRRRGAGTGGASVSVPDQESDTKKLVRLALGGAARLMAGPVTYEDQVLRGPRELKGRGKLFIQSPVYSDLAEYDGDYRLLSAGILELSSEDRRLEILRDVLELPEHELPAKGLVLGILGLPRSDFDSMLVRAIKVAAVGSSDTPVTPSTSRDLSIGSADGRKLGDLDRESEEEGASEKQVRGLQLPEPDEGRPPTPPSKQCYPRHGKGSSQAWNASRAAEARKRWEELFTNPEAHARFVSKSHS